MTVSRLKDGDWSFGGSKNDYIAGDDEIAQNVITRLKSFKNDWFLDEDANIDWLRILGTRNNRVTIQREVYRVTQATDGVWKVGNINIATDTLRNATIQVSFTTVNNTEYIREFTL